MFDPETVKQAFEKLDRLNQNLETLHGDMSKLEAMHADARLLASRLRDVTGRFKALPVLARQIAILNQIMLQTRKAAGTAGMFQTLLSGVVELAKRSVRNA